MPAHSLLQREERGQLHGLRERRRFPRSGTLLRRVTGGATLPKNRFLSPQASSRAERRSYRLADASSRAWKTEQNGSDYPKHASASPATLGGGVGASSGEDGSVASSLGCAPAAPARLAIARQRRFVYICQHVCALAARFLPRSRRRRGVIEHHIHTRTPLIPSQRFNYTSRVDSSAPQLPAEQGGIRPKIKAVN